MRMVVKSENSPARGRRLNRIALKPNGGNAGVLRRERRLELPVHRTGKRLAHHNARDHGAHEEAVRHDEEHLLRTPSQKRQGPIGARDQVVEVLPVLDADPGFVKRHFPSLPDSPGNGIGMLLVVDGRRLHALDEEIGVLDAGLCRIRDRLCRFPCAGIWTRDESVELHPRSPLGDQLRLPASFFGERRTRRLKPWGGVCLTLPMPHKVDKFVHD